MGLTEKSDRIYLRISHGSIRKTVKEGTPKAVSRENKEGIIVWELVWRDLSGTLGNIAFRDHEEYGKQWTLLIDDGDERFALQINENTRYGIDLLKKIPNLWKGMEIKVMPYDFKDENDSVKCGVSIKCGDVKIGSFYQEWNDDGKGKQIVKNLHNYPEYEGKWTDKDEVKVYFIQLAKFLRSVALGYIKHGFLEARRDIPTSTTEEVDYVPEKDGLPF